MAHNILAVEVRGIAEPRASTVKATVRHLQHKSGRSGLPDRERKHVIRCDSVLQHHTCAGNRFGDLSHFKRGRHRGGVHRSKFGRKVNGRRQKVEAGEAAGVHLCLQLVEAASVAGTSEQPVDAICSKRRQASPTPRPAHLLVSTVLPAGRPGSARAGEAGEGGRQVARDQRRGHDPRTRVVSGTKMSPAAAGHEKALELQPIAEIL